MLQALQQPLDARRPSLQLLEQILGHAGGGDDGQALRPLLSLGLLSAEDAGAPRSEWAMRVPSVIWDAPDNMLTEPAIEVSGLRISCAMAAANLPTAARRS